MNWKPTGSSYGRRIVSDIVLLKGTPLRMTVFACIVGLYHICVFILLYCNILNTTCTVTCCALLSVSCEVFP
jgi:hypothetical protein